MTRSVLISLCAALALAASATPARSQQLVTATDADDVRLQRIADPQPLLQPSLEQARSSAVPTRSPRRRRGSMVGYVEDSTIDSRVRVRFDSAFENPLPDRAEFFYAKCGCYTGLDHSSPLFDPDAPGPSPGIVTDLKFQQLFLEGEYAVSDRFSLFAQIPIRWLQPQSFVAGFGSFSNQSGLGDLRLGTKIGLHDSTTAGVTAKVEVFIPTGDPEKGLGTNHASVDPAVLYRQDLSSVIAIESQFGVWLPIGGSAPAPTSGDGHFAGPVLYYGIGPSFTVYQSDTVRLAPVVELVGWHVQSGNQTDLADFDAGGTNIVNIKFGARVSFGDGSVYAGYGHAMTDSAWYHHIFRMEYRHSF